MRNAVCISRIIEPFLGMVLWVYVTQGAMTPQAWGLALICLPAALLGAYLGIR
jgi:uncharacterized membrane protein YfcA